MANRSATRWCADAWGVLIEEAGLYPNMTARQNVVMKAKCMGLAEEKSIDQVLDLTGLSNTGKSR